MKIYHVAALAALATPIVAQAGHPPAAHVPSPVARTQSPVMGTVVPGPIMGTVVNPGGSPGGRPPHWPSNGPGTFHGTIINPGSGAGEHPAPPSSESDGH
ncbi:MAG: hypothetical protein WCP04_00735 [Pseudomonadota bacterium]|jgi:hypothetical protein